MTRYDFLLIHNPPALHITYTLCRNFYNLEICHVHMQNRILVVHSAIVGISSCEDCSLIRLFIAPTSNYRVRVTDCTKYTYTDAIPVASRTYDGNQVI